MTKNELNTESFPKAAIVTYQFPERDGGKLPPVTMTWYDGGLMPPTPVEMSGDQRLPDNGVLYVGSKGKMYHSSHGGMPQLLPGELLEQAKPLLPRWNVLPGTTRNGFRPARPANFRRRALTTPAR